MKAGYKSLKLKAVVECSFRRSEMTNLDLFRGDKSFPGDLTGNEVFMFVSRMGNQVVFIFNDINVMEGDKECRLIDSRRLRLGKGRFNPLMLQNYANSVGLDLAGLRRYEDVYADMQDRKKLRAAG